MNEKDEVSIGAVPEDYPRRLPGFRPRSVGFHACAGGYVCSLACALLSALSLRCLCNVCLSVCLSVCHWPLVFGVCAVSGLPLQ